jgi:phage shock protein C
MLRLVRPRSDRIIGGVCAGLGLYFGIDPVIVRLLFVVLAVTTFFTVPLYPILWAIMPEATNPAQLPPGARFDPQTGQPLSPDYGAAQGTKSPGEQTPETVTPPRPRILALVLVGVGTLILVNQLGAIAGIDVGSFVVPLALVGLGVYLLRGHR